VVEAFVLILLLGAAHVGWGALARTWGLGAARRDGLDWDDGLLGLVVSASLGGLVQLGWPLSANLATVWLAVGLGYASIAWWRTPPGRQRTVRVSLWAILVAGALASSAVLFGVSRDASLYHLQATQWLRQAPIALGLVHLHERLAFNSAWLINITWMRGAGIDLSGPMLATPVASACALSCLARGVVELPARPWSGAFAVLGASVLSILAVSTYNFTHWTSTDAIGTLLWVTMSYLYLRCLDVDDGAEPDPAQLRVLWLVGAYAMTVKLSLAPLMAAPVLCSLAAGRLAAGRRHLNRRSLGLCAGVLGIAALRQVALSGCLLYPVAHTCLPGLPWAARGYSDPLASSHRIQAWARHPGSDLWKPGWSWLNDGWLESTGQHMWTMWSTTATGAALLAVWIAGPMSWRRSSSVPPDPRWHPPRGYAGWAGTCVLGTAFWFATAPGLRFGEGVLVAFGVLPGAWVLSRGLWRGVRDGASRRRSAVVLATLGLLLLARGFWLSDHWLDGAPDWLHLNAARAIQRAATRTAIVDGVEVRVPRDQNLCWFEPRPCTPRLEPNLHVGHFAGHWPLFLPGD
jgi:hypothetical protein